MSQLDYPPDYDNDGDGLNDEDCIHVSYTKQAGGFLICDDCGEDITSEIFRSAAHEP
jgi:hypothetical protein